MTDSYEGEYDDLIKNIIRGIVNESTGIKATELVTNVCVHCREHNINIPATEDYFRYFDELVNAQEIVELDYVLTISDYKIKLLYFPQGTQLYPIGEVTTT